jgi:hypothetical protein
LIILLKTIEKWNIVYGKIYFRDLEKKRKIFKKKMKYYSKKRKDIKNLKSSV